MSRHSDPSPQADILIVDDTPDNLRLLNQMLSTFYKVRLAPSGTTGLAAARSAPPDLILLDVMMPDMNGYEVAARLKAGKQTEEIPIIFISALDDTESKVRGFAAGGVDYVAKPFQEKEVLARVKTHLALRSLYQQAQAEIIERKQIEEALRESELHYRALVEGIPGIVYSFSSKSGGVYYSSHVAEILGYSSAQLYAQPMLWHDSIHVDDLPRVNQAIRDTANGKSFNIEYRILDARGNWHWFDDRSIRYKFDDADVTIVGLALDITERKQAEESSRQREQEFKTLVEHTPDVVARFDREYRHLYVNPVVEKEFGTPPAMLLGKKHRELGQPAAVANWSENIIRQVFETGQEIVFELTNPTPTGNQYYLSRGVPEFAEDGSVKSVLFIHRNITERKQAEDALRASNTKLETLVRVSPLPIMSLDSNENIQLWNRAAEQIFGWASQEVLGHPNPIVPASKQNEYATWGAQILHDQPLINQETVRQRRDGSLVDVSVSSAPIYDTAGNVTGRMAILADITERKQAEESIRESEEKYRKIFNNEIDAICIFDVETKKILDVNNAYLKLYGYSRDEVLQLTTDDISAEYEKTNAAIQKAKAAGDVLVPERNHRKKDGTVFQVELSAGAYTWKGRNVMFALARDITVRKQAEEAISRLNAELEQRVSVRTAELELALKELEEISYTVSHDLRTPCRAIVGYSNIIQDEHTASLSPEVIRLLDQIGDNAQLMGKMVDGLLKFMHLNRKVLNVQDIEPTRLAKQALDALSDERKGRKIEIVLPQFALCKGDPELLLEVWYHFLSNAIKFTRTRETAHIEIGCLDGESDKLVFYVKDNGVGFNMLYSDKLFKVFHRLHHVQEFEGIGMGLALAHRAISQHGGRIWAEAKEDHGATFYFTLGSDCENGESQ